MGSLSTWHIVIVGALVLLLFGGGGKISSIMGDFAKGIKSFKHGLADDDEPTTGSPSALNGRHLPDETSMPQVERQFASLPWKSD
jgi:sec-independent protein translocase protein TatA